MDLHKKLFSVMKIASLLERFLATSPEIVLSTSNKLLSLLSTSSLAELCNSFMKYASLLLL